MSSATPTPEQIRRRGIEALARELGPVGMARFLQQFDAGQGDYTRDRDSWLPETDVPTLTAQIRQSRSQSAI